MSAPGSFVVRPAHADAEKSEEHFYAYLRNARNPQTLSLLQMAGALGITARNPEGNLSNKIKEMAFSPRERRTLLGYIRNQTDIVSGRSRTDVRAVAHAAYFGMLEMFNVDPVEQDRLRSRIEGTYKFWRGSVDHDGEYVFGKMTFLENANDRALEAALTIVAKARDGQPGVRELYRGYALRLSKMIVVIFRNETTDDIRLTVIHRTKSAEVGTEVHPNSIYAGRWDHYMTLDGYGAGVDGDTLFLAPVHLALVDDVEELDRLDGELDVVPIGDRRLPQRVLDRLSWQGGVQILG